ncbi:MAG: hypothetical protein Q8M27_07925 [Methylotenera sp.]|nr:hypothetical protein [Methylotenera sp.]
MLLFTNSEINEIFISPKLDDSVEVMDTLVHELVHAADNCEHKHGAEMKTPTAKHQIQML